MDREGKPAAAQVADPEPPPDTSASASDVLVGDFGLNAGLVEDILGSYQVDPSSVHPDWARVFEGRAPQQAPVASDAVSPTPAAPPRPVPHSPPAAAAASVPPIAPSAGAAPSPSTPTAASTPSSASAAPTLSSASAAPTELDDKNARVLRLIHAYRSRGHRIAKTDPLGESPDYFPELDPAHYGFGTDDLDHIYRVGRELPGDDLQTLGQIIERLERTYSGSIGVEFTHVQDPGRRSFLRTRMEECENQPNLSAEQRRQILERLSASELFERFLHTKFLGQKRFSLEGAESLIPLLDTIVEGAPGHGIGEIVFGMAHRGRLNVLANILGKSYESMFSEFEDSPLLDSPFGSGDVKYHRGFSKDRRTRSGEAVHLTLTSNPSHLEVVDPVVEGRTRAKQVRAGDLEGKKIIPVVIHGDAAFAGQGVVAETLNLARMPGYSTGGTIHLIVNNQIGFTTTSADARSTLYCTDVAKMIQVPVFHVNGDDPDAVVYCVELAMDYRQRFGDDVVIDMVCYRRHGHNEGDEPSFTQPSLYKKIRKIPSVRRIYTERLIESGVLSTQDAQRIEDDLGNDLQQALQGVHSRPPGPDEPYEPRGPWTGFERRRPNEEVDTTAPLEQLLQVAEGLGTVPQGFTLHPKLRTLLDKRRKSVSDDQPLDWAMGELLAYGTLVLDGTPVRLSGQDSARGTFSHRHAVVVDQETDESYCPLANLTDYQARFEALDSLLSEVAVLGFEYGYSLADPYALVLWEAQFGDFVNGAQTVIDQFIASAHVKWQRMSGLVMLLPHGYEGQGPEHSSARIERFLQICAEDSLQVANCTTPAQYFHLLRRQIRRQYRAPLVIFTPKSLLRSPVAVSPIEAFTSGGFEPLLGDPAAAQRAEDCERLFLCSGKVYYDIVAERQRRFGDDAHRVAVARVEQLYPWPDERVRELVATFPNVTQVVWVQEEPRNMGAWTFLHDRLRDAVPDAVPLRYAGRKEAASPATGSMRIHKQEQAQLLADAFDGLE
jgi:2-oxoglutarate dehydrogenase E1 component